ncbi:MAG: glycine--tRNA ligase subunit beta [Deferribacteraceae bacterium]|jgi:glycyl-tRNA synthetase beta chain|nr:glycine--tRNA ligase subunit beta [Deferribacteraceae bacterium]
MSFYLLEIGCEELPAAVAPLAAKYFEKEVSAQAEALCLPYKTVAVGATPRRVYLYIDGLPEKQRDREEFVQGPPARIAFNSDGALSEAGLKFAESKGLDLSTIGKKSTEKGEYLTGVKKLAGEETKKLFQRIIPQIIRSIPFPKSMRWGNGDMRFARPLKYFLSLWDGEILELGVEGAVSSDYTAGHRFLAPFTRQVKDFESYKKALKEMYVIADQTEREAEIRRQLNILAETGGYTVDQDEELMKTVVNLVEYPYAIEGGFDDLFLELPAPVLITSMKYHQKYFPVYGRDGILPKFIGISNMKPAEGDALIRQGYERVLKARLNDAIFFYNNDKNTPLEERTEALKKVVYQEKLGTSYEKMERIRALAVELANNYAGQLTGMPADAIDTVNAVRDAATLCKADLMCEMVYEFPELQGFMGRVYAKLQGKPAEIADAIEEHYMPRFAGDKIPASGIGKILSIADKLDTVAGAFAVGMIPSGNVDPYGLRRNTIGIINIIEETGWKIPLNTLILSALEQLKTKSTAGINETAGKLINFFLQRHKQILISSDAADADAYDAAAAVSGDLLSLRDCAAALTAAKKLPEFNSIAQSYKRINNILKKAGDISAVTAPELFEYDEERALYGIYLNRKGTVERYTAENDWNAAISGLTVFAAPLALYFDKVMVMAPDEKIRNNRLSMLSNLRALFTAVGNLGEIV